MTWTREDQRDKIRSQLIFELTHPEPPKIKANKSICGLQSKRHKFLQNPDHLKPADQKRSW